MLNNIIKIDILFAVLSEPLLLLMLITQ